MASNVTPTNGGGSLAQPGDLPQLTPIMRRILDRRQVLASYGGEAGTDNGGDFAQGAWIPPRWVDPRERDEAHAKLPKYLEMREPDKAAVLVFLKFLWGSAKHQNDQSWSVVERIYPAMLARYPRWCFRLEQTQEACFHFSWFPSVADLAVWLDHDCAPFLHVCAGLEYVATAPTKAPKDSGYESDRQDSQWVWPGGKAEAEAYTETLRRRKRGELADLARMIRERDAQAGRESAADHVPKPVAGESTDDFLRRQREFRHKILDSATEAMKRPDTTGRAGHLRQQARKADDARRSRPHTPEQIAKAARVVREVPARDLPPRPDIAERARVPVPAEAAE